MNVSFRSTWSKGSSIIDAHGRPHYAPMLKYAGWDSIVITGISKARLPAHRDDQVSLEDASEIWGRVRSRPTSGWWSRTAVSSKTASIGPAGVNLVDYSTLNTSFGNSGPHAGLGAAMGNLLKGLAIAAPAASRWLTPRRCWSSPSR